jgi:hypothetical protein
MKRWLGFLIILLSISFPVWAHYEFKMKLVGCDKDKIEDEKAIVTLIQTFTKSDAVSLEYFAHFNLFGLLLEGGFIHLKTYPAPKEVKVKINSKQKKNDMSPFIESLVTYFKPSFYTFTDPLSTN